MKIWTLIILLLVSFPYVHHSHACSCSAPIDYFQATEESEYVFRGTVTDIDNSDGPQKVYFDVSSVSKGEIPNGVFVLENNNLIWDGEFTRQSSCDVGYQVGVTYNVFVYDNINMNNGMCTTKPVGILGILNPIEYNLFYYVVIGLSVVGVSGFFILKSRK